MEKFYCIAENGIKPPKHKWNDYYKAVKEAKRLQEKLNCKVEVLKVVAVCDFEEVPVTKKVATFKEFSRVIDADYMPF